MKAKFFPYPQTHAHHNHRYSFIGIDLINGCLNTDNNGPVSEGTHGYIVWKFSPWAHTVNMQVSFPGMKSTKHTIEYFSLLAIYTLDRDFSK